MECGLEMSVITQLDIPTGGLWELGVLIPIKNPNMERFEFNTTLSADVFVGAQSITVSQTDISNYALPGATLFIGPSTSIVRDISSNLLYKNNMGLFSVTSSFDDTIQLTRYDDNDNYPLVLENEYMKGDSITLRSIAKDWTKLASDVFPSLSYLNDGIFHYDREETLDDFKGFAQAIHLVQVGDFVDTYEGIYQKILGRGRGALNEVKGRYVRMSSWVKATLASQSVTYADDIDENIGINIPSNDIDENIGVNAPSNDIDVNFTEPVDLTELPSVTLRSTFFDDTQYNSVVDLADYAVSGGQLNSSLNTFIYDVVKVPEQTISGMIGVYAKFPSNKAYENYRLYIDDIVLEHSLGTSKEADGFYQVDINPRIGLRTETYIDPKLTKNFLGNKIHERRGDTVSRYKIAADFGARPEYFVNDMLVLQEWNDRGFPIVLRPKMPGDLPSTIFCNINVSIKPNPLKATSLSDVSVVFEEISAL